MGKPAQIVPDVWLFQSEQGQWNCGILHDGKNVLLVDPGFLGDDLDVLERFLRDTERTVVAIVHTHNHGPELPDRWPDVTRLNLDSPAEARALSFSDWQLINGLGEERIGVYSPSERILFCGDLLTDPRSAVAVPSLAGGADSYLENLDTLEKIDSKLVIPASGASARGKRAIRERIERDRNYTYSVVRHVQATMASHIPLERAVQSARTIYSEYPFVEAHVDNLRSVWGEVEALLKGDSPVSI